MQVYFIVMVSVIFVGFIALGATGERFVTHEDSAATTEVLSAKTSAPTVQKKSGDSKNIFIENSEQRQKYPRAPELVAPSGFINTINDQGITLAQARAENKIVLLYFWTYGCINCKRTRGHLDEWYEKYHADGLEIIGVHYPEFRYERKVANVENFVRKNNIRYPVM